MEAKRKELLLEAGIEPDSAIERFMGNEVLYMKYLLRFTEDQNYQSLCEAVDRGACKEAFVAAHTLKGVCGNLSITGMEGILREQVEYLRNNELENAENMMIQLKKAYDTVKNTLESVRDMHEIRE